VPEMVEEAKIYGEEMERYFVARTEHNNVPDPDKRLKVGLVSGDLRIHAVSRFLVSVLAEIDPATIDLYAYATSPESDSTTEKLKAIIPNWRHVSLAIDARLDQIICDDGIDILVDLTLHMSGNRLPVFARQPAPVQVTWLGYPGTTGLDAIQYRITDPRLDPVGVNDAFYTEESLRLPDTFWCFDPSDAPDVKPLPMKSVQRVTFGCLNSFSKTNPQTLRLWAEVLAAVPDSDMVILADEGSHRDDAFRTLELALYHSRGKLGPNLPTISSDE